MTEVHRTRSKMLCTVPGVSFLVFHDAIQRRQKAKLPRRDKKSKNKFTITQRTPYDAVNDAQHRYHHQILVYPTINIVTRPIFHANSIALGGGWRYWACSDVSDVISTSSFFFPTSAHHGEDVGRGWHNSWMMPCCFIPDSNTLLSSGLAHSSWENIGGWSCISY